MSRVTDADAIAAMTLANQICGCADARQREGDVKQLLAYREAAALAERAKIVAWLENHDPLIATAIEKGQHDA